jgi:hypothetical protein
MVAVCVPPSVILAHTVIRPRQRAGRSGSHFLLRACRARGRFIPSEEPACEKHISDFRCLETFVAVSGAGDRRGVGHREPVEALRILSGSRDVVDRPAIAKIPGLLCQGERSVDHRIAVDWVGFKINPPIGHFSAGGVQPFSVLYAGKTGGARYWD